MRSEPGPAPGVAYAGFWIRFVAYVIDSVIVGIPVWLVTLASMGTTGSSSTATPNGGAIALAYIIPLAYLYLMWTFQSRTVGQMALGLRIVTVDRGLPIGPTTALLRLVGFVVATIPFWLGLLWAGWDPRKQGWHDKIAQTLVVRPYGI